MLSVTSLSVLCHGGQARGFKAGDALGSLLSQSSGSPACLLQREDGELRLQELGDNTGRGRFQRRGSSDLQSSNENLAVRGACLNEGEFATNGSVEIKSEEHRLGYD